MNQLIQRLIEMDIKKIIGFSVGWLSGYYLSTFALLSISIMGGMQTYWIYKNENDVDNINIRSVSNTQLNNTLYWKNVKDIVFSSSSLYPLGYITGIIFQRIKIWIIVIGLSSGYIIAYNYSPSDIELKVQQFWSNNRPIITRAFHNGYKTYNRVVHYVLEELDN